VWEHERARVPFILRNDSPASAMCWWNCEKIERSVSAAHWLVRRNCLKYDCSRMAFVVYTSLITLIEYYIPWLTEDGNYFPWDYSFSTWWFSSHSYLAPRRLSLLSLFLKLPSSHKALWLHKVVLPFNPTISLRSSSIQNTRNNLFYAWWCFLFMSETGWCQ